MNLKKTLLNVLMILRLCLLAGCDYIEKTGEADDLIIQQESQKSKIKASEKQQELDKRKIEHLERQRTTIINSTKMFAGVVEVVKDRQDEFVFTELNPAQIQYSILDSGSVDLAGKILSIDVVENGSVICISPVNLLSVPVSNMGSYATWGRKEPTDTNALVKWQQLLFSVSMDSSLKLLPGQRQDINLTLKGVSPNNLKYLKLTINVANIQFDRLQPAESPQRKSKK